MSRYDELETLKEQLKKGAPVPEQKKPEPVKEPEAAEQEPEEQPETEADDKPKRKKKVVEQE
jgi:hypothetical protein